MTGILFMIFVVSEIAYGVYSTISGSTHKIAKAYLHLTAFAFFLILCITGILQWSLRWYLLGAGLLFLAVKGLYVLVVTKVKPEHFSKKSIILKAFIMSLLYAVLLIPPFLFPQYEAIQPTGELDIATTWFTYTSKNVTDPFTGGPRQVNVGFWYPENGEETYPLVVFSHGAFGIRDSNISAYEELASHGYVVCSIDHPGHSFYTESVDGNRVFVNKPYLNEVINSNKESYYTKAEKYKLIQNWMKTRTEDINLTIDSILDYVSKGDMANVPLKQQAAAMKLYQSIDSGKIGVFGHSMGAAASVQIGRERNDVDAVINLDGPYFGEMTYDAAQDDFVSLDKPYNIPILNIYSDQVWVQLKDGTDTGVYEGNKISSQIAAKSYTVYLEGTKHLTLTDLAIVSPVLTNMLNGERAKVDAKKSIILENSLILGFFDEVLKGKGKFTPKEVYTVD